MNGRSYIGSGEFLPVPSFFDGVKTKKKISQQSLLFPCYLFVPFIFFLLPHSRVVHPRLKVVDKIMPPGIYNLYWY
jgi:hypothetical protein